MSDCIFCDLLAGRTAATFLHRDEVCAAFMDIRPVNQGHLLVVPIAHAVGLADLDPDTGAQIFRTAQRMAAALKTSGIRCEGVNLFLADGKAANQEVFHVHLHVFPRYARDGFGFKFAARYFLPTRRATLEDAAEQIRRQL